MRFPLEIVEAVRAIVAGDRPLFVRVSAVDGAVDGTTADDTVAFARELAAIGVDVVDCSSGGVGGGCAHPERYGYQVPYADRIRPEAGVATMAVGLIIDARQAEAIVTDGEADLVALGREAQDDPNWALHAARELTGLLRRLPGAGRTAAGLARPAARPDRPVDRTRPGAGSGVAHRAPDGPTLPGMSPRRLLVALSAAQLAAGLAGLAVAVRRRAAVRPAVRGRAAAARRPRLAVDGNGVQRAGTDAGRAGLGRRDAAPAAGRRRAAGCSGCWAR